MDDPSTNLFDPTISGVSLPGTLLVIAGQVESTPSQHLCNIFLLQDIIQRLVLIAKHAFIRDNFFGQIFLS